MYKEHHDFRSRETSKKGRYFEFKYLMNEIRKDNVQIMIRIDSKDSIILGAL